VTESIQINPVWQYFYDEAVRLSKLAKDRKAARQTEALNKQNEEKQLLKPA
jgi:hypothetical protein